MSRVKAFTCHFCDRRCFESSRIRVIVHPEGADNPFPVDLCPHCAGAWLCRFLHGLSPADQRRFLEEPLYAAAPNRR